MKLLLIAFAVIAAVAADVSHLPSNEYLPPVQESAPIEIPSNEYLAPVAAPVEAAPAHVLADDGYRYKTQRRRVIRRQRDVSHLPSNEYLPPVQESVAVAAPSNEYLPPVQVAAPAPVQVAAPVVEAAPAHVLADDGYRYKTQRRVVLRRHRRDVSHLPSNEYLPPVQESVSVAAPSNEYLAPVAAPVEVVEAAPAHVLADDGYRYKTQRRRVIRRQRDVSHLPSNEYLPPVQESVAVAAPSNEYLPPVQVAAPAPVQVAAPAPVAAPVQIAAPVVEAAPAHVLADDGYRYKTHRRVVLRRHRRDVSHLPSNEYLPPVQESVSVAAPSNEYLAPVAAPVEVVEAAPAHVLADDGYRYKTQRRRVIRRQRDVSHLPSNEYLPPAQESVAVAAPSNEYLAPVAAPVEIVEAAPAHVLADDGYRYKTQRRRVIRRQRDVSHLPSNEYLPPVQESVAVAAPSNEYLAPVAAPVEIVEAAPAHVLADDGYRYKTQRRRVIRRQRDVSHLPSNEYLPPAQESVAVAAPSNEYLAPVAAPVEIVEAAPAHVLADDGYRYKTQRRRVIRRQRDVSHLPSNEYLPPVQESVAAPVYQAPVEEAQIVVEAEPAHELAADGYRYKTHRRVVYRRH